MIRASDRMLLNFIPIGAPATRCPAEGEVRSFRASLGFIPQWYMQRLEISFGARWHDDHIYRYETLVQMKRLLHEKFPSLPEFMPRVNEKGYDPDCATLSGVYGSKVVSMLYDFPVCFPENDWPGDVSNRPISEETLRCLQPIDLDSNPFMERLERQMDEMERQFGRIEGFLNYQGVLNTALKLRGNDIFLDMIEDEAFADDLFAHIADTIERFALRVQKRQRATGVDIDLLSLSNCVVNMVSPDMYARFILPHDRRLSEKFQRFGVHTCNWNVTPYLEKLRQIPSLGYLDMGSMSDVKQARQMFPEARLAVLFTPLWLEQAPLDTIRDAFRKIAQDGKSVDFVLADMTETMSDERLRALLGLIDDLEKDCQ